jgi:hypothetical protein
VKLVIEREHGRSPGTLQKLEKRFVVRQRQRRKTSPLGRATSTRSPLGHAAASGLPRHEPAPASARVPLVAALAAGAAAARADAAAALAVDPALLVLLRPSLLMLLRPSLLGCWGCCVR